MATATVPVRPAQTEVKATQTAQKTRVGNLTDEKIVEQIRRLRQEAIDRNQRIMNTALDCWEQYRNVQDFTDKASWESRVTLAKAHAAVKHFTANMMRLLTQAEQWVTVEDVQADVQQSFAPFVEKGILKTADLAGFHEVFREAVEYSGATMFGALKVIWQLTETEHTTIEQGEQGLQQRQQTRLQGRLGLYALDPWKIHFGPRTKGGRASDYVIEDSDADIATLYDLGGFENLDSFISEDKKPRVDSPSQAQRLGQIEPVNESRVRRRIELWDFWGDLIDEQTQKVIARNVHVIVGNGEKIVKYGDNQLWDKKPPYIIFSPLIVAGRFPGGGILEMNIEVKRAIDRIAQMWEDHLHFSVLPMWEAELAALENPEDVATGVYPGKVFRKKPGQGPNQIFRPLLTNPMGLESFNTVIAFDKEYQRGTFITEQTQGLIDAKGETTATEVQQTVLASTLILSDIAMHIEHECLAPLGEMIWDRLFQFMDSTSYPNWSQLVGGPLGEFMDMLPIEMRTEIVRGRYTFASYGLSRVIERQQQRNSLIQYVQTLGQLGPVQVLLNWPIIFKRMHESFHLPQQDELLAPNWQQMFQQWQFAMMAQANPLYQQEMKNEGQADKTAQQTDQVLAQENARSEGAIMKEVAKAALNPPQQKGKKNGD